MWSVLISPVLRSEHLYQISLRDGVAIYLFIGGEEIRL